MHTARIIPALLPEGGDIPQAHCAPCQGPTVALHTTLHPMLSPILAVSSPSLILLGSPATYHLCLLAPDPSSCLRGSPEQIDSCHKHSSSVIQRYLQGSSCSLTPGLPPRQIRRVGRRRDEDVHRENCQVQRFPSPLLNLRELLTTPVVRVRTLPSPHQARKAEVLALERWNTSD